MFLTKEEPFLLLIASPHLCDTHCRMQFLVKRIDRSNVPSYPYPSILVLTTSESWEWTSTAHRIKRLGLNKLIKVARKHCKSCMCYLLLLVQGQLGMQWVPLLLIRRIVRGVWPRLNPTSSYDVVTVMTWVMTRFHVLTAGLNQSPRSWSSQLVWLDD